MPKLLDSQCSRMKAVVMILLYERTASLLPKLPYPFAGIHRPPIASFPNLVLQSDLFTFIKDIISFTACSLAACLQK